MSYPDSDFWEAEAIVRQERLYSSRKMAAIFYFQLLSELKSWIPDYFKFFKYGKERWWELTFSDAHAPLETALFFCCWPRSHSCMSWKGNADTLVNTTLSLGIRSTIFAICVMWHNIQKTWVSLQSYVLQVKNDPDLTTKPGTPLRVLTDQADNELTVDRLKPDLQL